MTKRNKTLTILFTFIVITAFGVYFIFGLFTKNKVLPPAANALTENVLFFYKGVDFISFYKDFYQKGFLKDLNSNQTMHRIDQQLRSFDSLIKLSQPIAEYLKSNEIIIGICKTSGSGIDILGLIQTKKKFTYEDISKLVDKKKNFNLVKRNFKDVTIYDYQLTPQKSLIVFAITKGILIISPNGLLVEDAISMALKNGSTEIKMTRYTKTIKNENLFINFSEFNAFLELFLSSENKNIVSTLKNFAGIGKYEAEFKKDYISLRGELMVKDSANDYITLFYAQTPRSTNIQKIIPDRTALLLSFNLDNFPLYYEKYIDRLKKTKRLDVYHADLKKFEDKYHISINESIIPLLQGQYSLAINEPITEDLVNCSAVIIKVNDNDKAIKIFNQFNENEFKGDTSGKNFKSEYKNLEIYRSNISESFSLLFGNTFGNIKKTYFVSIRDYLVFSANLTNLKRFIDDYRFERTLNNSTEFNKFSEKFITETNFLFYMNPMRSVNIPDHFADSTFINNFHLNMNYFNNFNFFIFDFANNNNSFYTEIIANYTSKVQVNKENLWSVELEAPLSGKPVVVKNSSSNFYDILVFDESNKLYCITSSGTIQWSKKLSSKPQGTISLVDLFNNNKTQYLFATQNQINMIDRLGKNAGSFPIKLTNKALTGICVISEKDKNQLKIYVGCENNTIYGFDKTGKPLKGWNPKKIKGNLSMPLKSFSKSGKTYLYGVTDQGVFYLFNQKGKEIFQPVELKTTFRNSFFVLFGNKDKDTRMISVDTTGSTYFIDMEGEAQIKKLGKWEKEVLFSLTDLKNKGTKELLYFTDEAMVAYSTTGNIIRSVTLLTPPGRTPEIINLKNKNYLAYPDKENENICLIDISGNNVQSFPYAGSPGFLFFDINKDNITELIRSEGNILYLSRF